MSENSKIKIIRYPYKDHKVGDIVDLGFEKNKSMVALQRAVWYDAGELRKMKIQNEKDPIELVVQEVAEEVKEVVTTEDEENKAPEKENAADTDKKFLENEVRKEVQKKKTGNNFWDNLK